MAFQVRFAQVVIEKSVVFEAGKVQLVRVKVQNSLEEPKGLLLVQHLDGQEIIDLVEEARSLVMECGLGTMNFFAQQQALFFPGQECL